MLYYSINKYEDLLQLKHVNYKSSESLKRLKWVPVELLRYCQNNIEKEQVSFSNAGIKKIFHAPLEFNNSS